MDKILIIEDEPAIRDILRELLTDAGYEVEEAADGLEGVEKFRAGSFSLVLLDLMLPKLDGYGVCEQIRAVSDVPVIMITALSGEEAEVRAFELRADDYITKPFSLRLVLMRVEAVLRRAGGKADEGGREILRRGSVEMDTAAHRVSLDGEDVPLTNTEYRLLELFLRNPGRVFTREGLLSRVWGYDFIGDESTVNIHIMNLRRKLGSNLIETVRGVGYRLG
ncbi:MAG TPA: response regulator transcription factor [Candidatus Scatomorpha gallistercoris]|nr:response regulator transcription factor [Candidatus Scatomorpha gallistercoris]